MTTLEEFNQEISSTISKLVEYGNSEHANFLDKITKLGEFKIIIERTLLKISFTVYDWGNSTLGHSENVRKNVQSLATAIQNKYGLTIQILVRINYYNDQEMVFKAMSRYKPLTK